MSQKGTRTDDNRDHAGIAGRNGEFLAIVADGATNGSNNGGYARAIVEAVVDWFAGEGLQMSLGMLLPPIPRGIVEGGGR